MSARISVWFAGALAYYAMRVLGATEKKAWSEAKIFVGKAVLDKTVELTGIQDPRRKGDGLLQVTFEGGPIYREIRHVQAPCETITVQGADGEPIARYRRTERMRGQSVIFEVMA